MLKSAHAEKHMLKRAHVKESTYQKQHVPKGAHTKKSKCPKELIPKSATCSATCGTFNWPTFI